MATDNPKAMTPTAAVARHLEWLEFALAAARDEEVRRQGRVERATDKNRQKRSVRLAEVTAEVRELAALVTGLKDIQAKATGPAKRSRSAAASRSRASAAVKAKAPTAAKPKAATAAKPKAAPAAKPKSAPAATAKAPSTTRAKAPSTRRAASKPSGAGAKAPTRRRTRTRSTRRTPPSA
jgi:hypothetical protein